jgi:hypothetical protein
MSEIETTSAPAASGPDLNAIADRLFGSTPPSNTQAAPETPAATTEPATAPQTPAETKPATETQEAATELPDAVRELRDDPLRRMFSPQGTYASVQLEEAMANLPLDGETKAAEASEWREIFADIGASPQDARELVQAADIFTSQPMTPQRDAANVNAARQLMTQQFGADADQALADAQALVKRDPRLANILERSRLGNDPKTVVKVAQLARSAKLRG